MEPSQSSAKVIVIGHKILNLDELFTIATYDSAKPGLRIEVAVDSPLYSELNKQDSKEKRVDHLLTRELWTDSMLVFMAI